MRCLCFQRASAEPRTETAPLLQHAPLIGMASMQLCPLPAESSQSLRDVHAAFSLLLLQVAQWMKDGTDPSLAYMHCENDSENGHSTMPLTY